MENGTRAQFRGTKTKQELKIKTHTHTTTVFFFSSSCKRLFVQTRTESGQITKKGTSLSTRATTTHKPVQHQPHQHGNARGVNSFKVPLMCTTFTFSGNTLKGQMELLQKHDDSLESDNDFVPNKHREGADAAFRVCLEK